MKPKVALIFSLAAICRAASANLGLSFDKRAGSLPTLKLPYATYRAASYNPNGDVCLARSSHFFLAHLLTFLADLHLQEHPLRCPTSRRPSMGQTGAPSYRDRNSGWLLRAHLHSSTRKSTKIDGTRRQQFDRQGCKSIPHGGNTNSILC